MGRPLRIAFEGALYHITTRGNNRRAIFRRSRDRLRFLDFLSDTVKTRGWIVYAYCLMRNHFHLLVETPLANISRGMQQLNGRYARYFNYIHKRTGHPFERRFHTKLVQKEPYLRELCRYVVLNPVRAGICAAAEDYPWSSYRSTMGLETPPDFLRPERVLELFGNTVAESRAAYARFVGEGAHSRPWDHLKEDLVLGDDDFVQEMKERIENVVAAEMQ